MSKKNYVVMDGNTAAAYVAYAFTEVAAIYPITPPPPRWRRSRGRVGFAKGRKNLFGSTVNVIEMQSEAGAAGTCHGSLQAGALTTTYTASQGLMLMIPPMFRIAGEFLPAVFHVSARTVAQNMWSIFGDQSDVMTCRSPALPCWPPPAPRRRWTWAPWPIWPPSRPATPSCTSSTASAPLTSCRRSTRWTMRTCVPWWIRRP